MSEGVAHRAEPPRPASGEAPAPAPPSVSASLGLDRYAFTRGKLAVLAAAGLLVVAGAGLRLAGVGAPEQPAVAEAPADAGAGSPDPLGERTPAGGAAFTDGGGAQGFAPLPRSSPTTDEPTPAPSPTPQARPAATPAGALDWPGALLRGGFGLLVGFALGYAVRAIFKLATVLFGLYVLSLALLAYVGWIEIHWGVIEAQGDQLLAHLRGEFESFTTFLAGTLPSAGLGAVGLGVGLKRT